MGTIGQYSSSSLGLQHSDAVSTIHPDRPIRPLPKKRIRSRLSDEKAESILHSSPSAPPEKLFQLPYYASSHATIRSVSRTSSLDVQASNSTNGENVPGEVQATSQRNGKPSPGHQSWSTSSPLQMDTAAENKENNWQNLKATSQSLASSADSVDGYDSFENTNNKKKRKIPANGGHHSSLSTEMASMGLSNPRDVDGVQADMDGGIGHYYGTGSSAIPAKPGIGIAGAGRGRYGRINARRRSTRSPLGTSINGSNSTRLGQSSASDAVAKENLSPDSPSHGIISAAIANAAALPGAFDNQEHVSVAAQQSSKRHPAGRTQFTFTCESDSAKSMTWPGYGYPSLPAEFPNALPNGVDGAYDGIASQAAHMAPPYGNTGHAGASQTAAANMQASRPRKPRRPLSKQYAMAAKDRRVRQSYNNFHHPPKEEEVWICEYCEYEAIFGTPPQALVRQYEIKDRRERRRLAEKQRLLEKAKMKGKRGKKGGKNAKNANAAAPSQQQNQKQPYDPQVIDHYPVDPGLQADEYPVDEEDNNPLSTPPLAPRVPSKIPKPVGQYVPVQRNREPLATSLDSSTAVQG